MHAQAIVTYYTLTAFSVSGSLHLLADEWIQLKA